MTVTRITLQGYLVCTWRNLTTRTIEERMFLPEMLEEYRPDR